MNPILSYLETLENTRPSINWLQDALKHKNTALTYAVLCHIDENIPSYGIDEKFHDYFSLFPIDLGGLPPESLIVLARIYRRMPKTYATPDWQSVYFSSEVKIAWLQTEIIRNPEQFSTYQINSECQVAVQGLNWNSLNDHRPLLRLLSLSGDETLQVFACKQISKSLSQGKLLPSAAYDLLVSLLKSPLDLVVESALSHLRQPWFVCFPCPQNFISLNSTTAIQTLANWPGNNKYLLDIAIDSNQDKHLRAQAIELWGKSGEIEQVDFIFAAIQENPLFFGKVAIQCLRDICRCSGVITKKQWQDVFYLFLDCPTVELRHIVELVDTHWKCWLSMLSELSFLDASWPRQIRVLQYADVDDVSKFLLALLDKKEMKPWWGNIIQALGKLEDRKSEARILELIDQEPDAAIEALKRVGGTKTYALLLERLESKESQPFSRRHAIEVLLAISEETEAILDFLDPQELNAKVFSQLMVEPVDRIVGLLEEVAKQKSHPHRQEAINRLGKVGRTSTLLLLQDLLIEEDEDIREIASEAIESIGVRLYKAGKARPSCLLDVELASEAGEFVLADCVFNMISRCDNRDNLALLFQQLPFCNHPRAFHYLKRWLHHDSPHILESMGKCRDPRLGKLIFPFIGHSDIRLSRQAIIALGRMGAVWAAKEIAKALDHPNMNIKKSAAEALAKAGDVTVVPSLINWLACHDNFGFRKQIQETLQKILGDGYIGTLLAELTFRKEPREIRLLLTALEGKISHSDLKLLGIEPLYSKTFGDSFLTDEKLEKALTVLDNSSETAELKQALSIITANLSMNKTWYHHLRLRLPYFIHTLKDPLASQVLNLLELMVRKLSKGEKVILAEALRSALKQEKIPLVQGLDLLKNCQGVLPQDLAFRALQSNDFTTKEWALELLCSTNSLDEKQLTELISQPHSISLQKHMISFALRKNYPQALFAAMLKGSLSPHVMRRYWTGHPSTVECLITALKKCSEEIRGELLGWLSCFDDAKITPLMMNHLQSKKYRYIAMSYLQSRPSSDTEKSLGEMLESSQIEMRQCATTILLSWPSTNYRLQIIDIFLEGNLKERLPSLYLNFSELEHALAFAANKNSLTYLITLIHQARTTCTKKISSLFTLLDQEISLEEYEQVKNAIRQFPTEEVFPYITEKLHQESWSFLDLLSSPQKIIYELSFLLESSSIEGKKMLLAVLARNSFTSGRSQIAEQVIALANSDIEVKLAIQVMGPFTDWENPTFATQFANCLQSFFVQENYQRVALAAFFKGVALLPSQEQVHLLCQCKTPEIREEIILRLLEIYVKEPSIHSFIPKDWHEQLHKQLTEHVKSRDEELVRRCLNILVDENDEMSLDLLEQAMKHPSSRVRAYAHRLLRRLASRERYLEATCLLLKDKVYELRRLAIRALSFGHYLPAVKEIAKHLYLKKKKLDKTAHRGLCVMGEPALPILKHMLGKARPDKRPQLIAVIKDIENGEVNR